MKNFNAAVFLNGVLDIDKDFFSKPENDYSSFDFFCADGGANHAVKLGIKPKVVMGDLDSVKPETLDKLENVSEIISYPVDKDKTDAELLLEYLKMQDYRNIHIFAATGGRTDHSLANIFLLLNFPGCQIVNCNEIISIAQKHSRIVGKKNHQLSLIPLSHMICNLSIKGCKFNLDKTNIYQGSSLAMSNTIISDRAELIFESGKLLMVISNKKTSDNQ